MNELDLIGIGIGPSNLSLAALLAPLSRVRARFFDRRPAFGWHPGMMLPGTRMQTSFLKDLVTPVDPTSPFGFLSYLVAKGRFYRFLNAEFSRARRTEFADYLRWVAEQLPSLAFSQEAREILHDERGFSVVFADGSIARSNHLVVATGLTPHVPAWATPHSGPDCVHAHAYLETPLDVEGRRVLVVGGGQSGAEIFMDLLSGRRGHAERVQWATRRGNLDPLDETAFTNEYFTPDYVRSFHRLPPSRRHALAEAQKLTGDGVSPETLRDLSQLLYERDFLRPGAKDFQILPHREVQAMERTGGVARLIAHNGFNQSDEAITADIVILATGYRHSFPSCMDALSARFPRDSAGHVRLEEDYSVAWAGAATNRIYMQNVGRYSHGVADAQLSLAAWRSAVIVNSLLGSEIYPTAPSSAPVDWTSAPGDAPWGEPSHQSILS